MEIILLLGFLAIIRQCAGAPIKANQSTNRKNFIPNRFELKGAKLTHGKPNYIQVIPGTGQPGDPPIISSPGRPQPQPAAPQGTGCAGAQPDPCNPYGPPPSYAPAPDPYGQYSNPAPQVDPYGYQRQVQYPVPPPPPVQYPQAQPPCQVASYPC